MSQVNDEFRNLSGMKKAAIFMLAIGREHSAQLFAKMDEQEIRDLSESMAELGEINADVVERLFVEFADQLSSAGGLIGTMSSTERLLLSALDPDQVAAIMEDLRGPAGRTMWDKLGNVNEAVLANYLKNEYPQTVAVVLSKLTSDHASRVLAVLPESFSMEVIMRMLRMGAVQKDVLESVEKTLRSEFMTNLGRTPRHDSHELMAEIFNNLDPATEDRFMTSLEEKNSESAERIRALMFTFDDLARLDPTAVQVLLRQVEGDVLGLALKGSSEEIRTLFFSNMSERAGKMMQEDMEAMGGVRLKDVEEAKASIVTNAKALADAGEIVIAGGDGDDEMIY